MTSNNYDLNVESGVPRFSYDANELTEIEGAKISVIQTKFYSEYTNKCVEKFDQLVLSSGVKAEDVVVDRLPGTLEVPLAARTIAKSMKPDAIAFFGGVVDTDTKHAEMIMRIFTQGIVEVMLEIDIPILVGLIYVPKIEFLIERCQDDAKNYGIKIAQATTEIVSFRRKYQTS